MTNYLLLACRRIALRRHRSQVPTTLVPLRELRSATVFVDATEEGADTESVCLAVRRFFENQGIPVRILNAQKKDVNLLGYLKHPVRGSHKNPRQEDLFISLAASPDNFAAEFEARCSTARFKVGRCALPGQVYDLVVSVPSGGEASQSGAFSAISPA